MKKKKKEIKSVGEDVEKKILCAQLTGLLISAAVMENSIEVKNTTAI